MFLRAVFAYGRSPDRIVLETGTILDGTGGNPLDDITAVRRVVFVMKGGKVYKNTLSRR